MPAKLQNFDATPWPFLVDIIFEGPQAMFPQLFCSSEHILYVFLFLVVIIIVVIIIIPIDSSQATLDYGHQLCANSPRVLSIVSVAERTGAFWV